MRIYPQNVEDNMRDESLIQDWINSGLLHARQQTPLRSELQTPLRTTNNALRAVLALFTMLIGGASVGLTFVVLDSGRGAEWLIFGFWAVACAGAAWGLAQEARLYRCGVEEALAVLAVFLLAASIGSVSGLDYRDLFAILAGMLGSVGVYLVFGYRYALVGATLLAGVAPFSLHAGAVAERLLSLLVFGLVFFLVRHIRGFVDREIEQADFGAAQGAAYVGFYLTCNLMIAPRGIRLMLDYPDWFLWSTYVVIWIVPALALWQGITERDRLVLNLGWLSMMATILTNKTYLQWPRHTWDPILLGVLLMMVAILTRRWLVRGPGGERFGFTPARLLHSEERVTAAASAVSLVLPYSSIPETPRAAAEAPQSTSFKPGGGRSGGGGASGNF